jgi:pimeloyl-ACP methyl ester carboxylesterase
LPAREEKGLVRRAAPAIWVETRGAGTPTLLLIHGLGANGRVWDACVEEIAPHWGGRIVVPDLRGHGRSDPGAAYHFGFQAADLGEVIEPQRPLVIVGHSLGGLIALTLASGAYRLQPAHVIAIGVMPRWDERHLAQAAELASRPVGWFEGEDEAVRRFLWLSGLAGHVDPASAAARSGVVEQDGRHRLRQDPASYFTGPPDLAGLLAAARCPVDLVYGESDSIVDLDLVAREVSDPQMWDGGHNLHLEQPARLARLVLERAAAHVR